MNFLIFLPLFLYFSISLRYTINFFEINELLMPFWKYALYTLLLGLIAWVIFPFIFTDDLYRHINDK